VKKFIVILAGGEGKRLQSVTGDNCPKQFFRKNPTDKNMLEETFERLHLLHLNQEGSIITTTKEKYKEFLSGCSFKGLNKIAFEEESCKNTAPAMFNIIYALSAKHGESLFAFFPVDHEINDLQYFSNTINKTMRLAEKIDKIFLLGTKPKDINLELGYISVDSNNPLSGGNVFSVNSFIEKPSFNEVEELDEESLFTNMGIFVGKGSLFLESFLAAGLARQREQKPITGDSFDREIIPYVLDKLVMVEYDSSWQDLGLSLVENNVSEELFVEKKETETSVAL
jgi:mannose-1-phosphate guanylyltransferase